MIPDSIVAQFAERAYEQCRSQHIQEGSIDPTFIIEEGNFSLPDHLAPLVYQELTLQREGRFYPYD